MIDGLFIVVCVGVWCLFLFWFRFVNLVFALALIVFYIVWCAFDVELSLLWFVGWICFIVSWLDLIAVVLVFVFVLAVNFVIWVVIGCFVFCLLVGYLTIFVGLLVILFVFLVGFCLLF